MPAKVEAYKDVIDKLNQLVAEAHAQAPAEARTEIEAGYEEVVARMFRLLTHWVPGPSTTSAGVPLGTCTVPGMGTYQTTQAQCAQFPGSSWHPRFTDPRGHP